MNKDEIITEAHEYFDDVHYVWMRVPSFWVGDFVATHSHKIKCSPRLATTLMSETPSANPIDSALPPTGALADSRTIGNRPFWFLPVDSATNCSIQSPIPGTFDLLSISAKF